MFVPDRQYISQFAQDFLGYAITSSGTLVDPDGDVVVVTVTNSDTGAQVFSRNALRAALGQYQVNLSSAETATPGNFTATANYTVGGVAETYQGLIQVGKAAPPYDVLSPDMKSVVESVWARFADLFDSPLGGPNLETYFQTKFDRGRIAQMLRLAVGRLNTVSQPFQTYTIDGDGGGAFPVAQWGALLERACYCVDPSTPVLRDDLQWVPAGEMKTGDKVVAFDEEIVGGKFRTATVLATKEQVSPRLRVSTSLGDVLVTPEHRFVVRRRQGNGNGRPIYRRAWCEARKLRPEIDEIVSIGEPWSTSSTYEAGYLSGLMDGEGCLTFSDRSQGTGAMMSRIFFAQKPGVVMDKAKEIAKSMGFEMAESASTNVKVLNVRGGFTEQLRFLGTLRPLRLMAHPQFNRLWEGRAMRQIKLPSAHVLGVQPTLDGPVSVIQTSTGTLLTAGLLSHNCEVLKHLRRSYVEQPQFMGGQVTRLDRRDYLQRWGEILEDEEEDLKGQLDSFKIANMGLGKPTVLVSGGVYGRWAPTRLVGSAAARGIWFNRGYVY